MEGDTRDIVEILGTRFDPRIVFPDEVSRAAAAEITELRRRCERAELMVLDAALKIMEYQALRDKSGRLAAYAATCEQSNTPEWMAGLVDRINDALAALKETDRVELVQPKYRHLPVKIAISGEQAT